MVFKDYRQTSSYGYRTHPITGKRGSFHAGIDLVKLKGGVNAPIEAFTAGTVVYADLGKSGTGLGGYGNVVLIRDRNNYGQLYAHLHSVSVRKGQSVSKGQVIGRQGATGNVTGAHLHYEVRKKLSPSFGWTSDKQSSTVNPTNYLKNFKHGANLKVDGKWGNDTTKALQKYFGTVVDGYLSGQSQNTVTNALYGNTVKYGKNGSLVIKALQKFLNSNGAKLKVDGLLGPATVRALQRYLGTVVDGKLSRPSLVVKVLQKRLNAGKL